jgi:hypothetical protein
MYASSSRLIATILLLAPPVTFDGQVPEPPGEPPVRRQLSVVRFPENVMRVEHARGRSTPEDRDGSRRVPVLEERDIEALLPDGRRHPLWREFHSSHGVVRALFPGHQGM